MSGEITSAGSELANLRERARKLAMEKSYLQLVNNLMNRLSEAPGLEQTVETILRLIVDNLGGTQVAIYYWVAKRLHYASVYGERKVLEAVDDPMVRAALERQALVDVVRDFADTKMMTPAFTAASHWAMPLTAGGQVVAVLKAEATLVVASESREQLQPFFNYAAMILKNEIESHLKLAEASQLAAIVESSQDAIIGKTLDGVITSWNRGAERMYGYTEQEMIGQPIALLAPPERENEIDLILQQSAKGESVEHLETVRRRKDGQIIHVSLTVSPIRNAAGQAVGASTIARDVTEGKRAEEALRESEDRYRKLVAASPDAITTTNPLGRVTLASTKALEMFRVASPAQVQGRAVLEWVAPEDRARAEESLRQLLTTGSPSYREFVLRRDDDTTFDAEVNGSLIQASDGTPLGMILVTRDITERRRAAESLRKLSRAVEQSPVSIVITDPAGNIEYVNPKFTAVTGYSMAEVFGENPRILKSGEMSEESYHQLWRTITSGLEWRGEFHNRRKNGELYWELASISPILDATGKITHFLAVKEDITEQRRLEEEFRQAQKLEAVGRLAGGVAHDFNNILTAILMNLSLLKEDNRLVPQLLDGLDELEREANRAASLTRQLLLFSRRQALDAKPLDLNEVIHSITKMLRRLIGEDVDLVFHGQSSGLWIMADAGMMDQVLMNLCVNARDAMPDGGQLTIGTRQVQITAEREHPHPEARPGPFVCLSVADSGCGMDEETQRHIFEPFFTTKQVGKGTGLGLATVYSIVHQHHGWIEIESSVGKGSVFHLFFPALPVEEYRRSTARQAPVRGGGETILLVEDDPSLRRLASLELRKLGYTVLEAADGIDASGLWKQHQGEVNLLFTDMIMPGGMSGFDLAQLLMREKPALKVLVTSGYTADRARPEELSAQGISYLAKPYEAIAMAEAVRASLD